jgi:hypothetical protein
LRSPSGTDPWTDLLSQSTPNAIGPVTIRFVDNTFGIPYYYKLDAFNSGTLVSTYGPVFLSP